MGISNQRYPFSTSASTIAFFLFLPNVAGADVPPPSRFLRDGNGVDLARGTYSGRTEMLSIGSGKASLSITLDHSQGYPSTSEYELGIYGNASSVDVVVLSAGGQRSLSFSKSGTVWMSRLGDGATFSQSGSIYVLKTSDGTEYTYNSTLTSVDSNRIARVTQVRYASGERLTMTYLRQVGCSSQYQAQCGGGSNVPWKVRMVSVSSSSGYQLHFNYESSTAADNRWNTLVKITAFNMAVDACDAAAYVCGFSQNWPSINLALGQTSDSWTIADNLGRITTYTTSKVRRQGLSSDDVTVAQVNGRVSSITSAGQTWRYGYSGSGLSSSVVITNPDGTKRTVVSDIAVGLPTRVTDESGAITSYSYDSSGRLSAATSPSGVQEHYQYDPRGNVTETRKVSTPAGSLADLVSTAGYDLTCSNGITCNQPNWTKDWNGAQTDYRYDPTHGGVLTITRPATDNGVRGQTRYSYTALQAYYKNGAGSIGASGAPTYLLTSSSACRTVSSCSGTADETLVTLVYGTQGVANNLLPTRLTTAAGNAAVAATTSITYNGVGDPVAVDGPLPGVSDTRRTFYNDARQVTMTVGPDPDGAGALRGLATSISYDSLGRETAIVRGTSNGDGSAFVAADTVSVSYDAADRETRVSASASGSTYALTQFSYDVMGRPMCTATRMNPSAFSSQPDACLASTKGSDGADRIARTSYNIPARKIAVTQTYGTTSASTEQTVFTASGQLLSVVDGNNNSTIYSYDGFDRLSTTTYSGGSYEQLGYNRSGQLSTRRLRDGKPIGYTYDQLGRLKYKDRPNSIYWETDHSFGYDNFGHLISASDSNGHALSFVYDALGRQTSQGDNWYSPGNMSFIYDTSGQRTRQTWWDGFFVTFDHNATGAVTVIRENGGTALATFAYDGLGRRTSLTRGNGNTTTYGYDAASRLTSLGLRARLIIRAWQYGASFA